MLLGVIENVCEANEELSSLLDSLLSHLAALRAEAGRESEPRRGEQPFEVEDLGHYQDTVGLFTGRIPTTITRGRVPIA